jgi:hypothetical protein
MPNGFPNVELRHRFSSSAAVSGKIYLDDIFFRALPSPQESRWNDLISFGSTWKYLSATPPANWFATDFNDLTWSIGNAKFGRGSGPTNVVTQLPANKPSHYFRKTFSVTQTNIDEFLLAATCTDDYCGTVYPLRIFLNGTELMTSGIEAVSSTGNETKYFDLFPFIDLLKPGTNTIAVILNNAWQSSWDDVAFDIALKTIPAPAQTSARIAEIRYNSVSVDIGISAPLGSALRLESAETPTGPWKLVQLVPNISIDPFWISDKGQNGRGVISQSPARFYRLAPY